MTDLLSLDSDGEDINRLFPKCRPKSMNGYYSKCEVTADIGVNKNLICDNSSSSVVLKDRNDNLDLLLTTSAIRCSSMADLDVQMTGNSPCDKENGRGLAGDPNDLDKSVLSGYDIIQDVIQHIQVNSEGRINNLVSHEMESEGRKANLTDSSVESTKECEGHVTTRHKLLKKKPSEDQRLKNKERGEDKRLIGLGEVLLDDGRMKRKILGKSDYNVWDSSSSRSDSRKSSVSISSESDLTFKPSDKRKMIGISNLFKPIRETRIIHEPMKETVFGKEVLSLTEIIENPVVYETEVGGNEVIFDDIGEMGEKGCPGNLTLNINTIGKLVAADGDWDASDSSSIPDGLASPDSAFVEYRKTNSSEEAKAKDIVNRRKISSDTDIETEESLTPNSSPDRQPGKYVIDPIQIAEYEGSPKRYKPRSKTVTKSSSPTFHNDNELPNEPPRPGHPKRIVNDDESKVDNDESDLASKSTDSSTKCSYILDGIDKDESIKSNDNDGIDVSKSVSEEYNYFYELSETRKVLEEFFKPESLKTDKEDFSELDYKLHRQTGNSYVGRRLAGESEEKEESPKKTVSNGDCVKTSIPKMHVNSGHDLLALRQQSERTLRAMTESLDNEGDASTNPETEDLVETEMGLLMGQSRNFTLSPETTDCDSNDVESEMSIENEGSMNSSSRMYNSMPVLEDGLSSGHASEAEEPEDQEIGCDKRPNSDEHNPAVILMKKQINEIEREIQARAEKQRQKLPIQSLSLISPSAAVPPLRTKHPLDFREVEELLKKTPTVRDFDLDYEELDPLRQTVSPPPPAPHPHREGSVDEDADKEVNDRENVEAAIQDIKLAIQRTKSLRLKSPVLDRSDGENGKTPVWVPRTSGIRLNKGSVNIGEEPPRLLRDTADEDDLDTDQETDRLLGQQRSDDAGFYDEKGWRKPKSRTIMPSKTPSSNSSTKSPSAGGDSSKATSVGGSPQTPSSLSPSDAGTNCSTKDKDGKKKSRSKEVLIEGVLFRAKYLGSTQLVCEGQPTKAIRMMQAEEAVSRIKAPEGESQPSTEVDLFISTEKIMVLNTDLKEIMMDHALRSISYIADIGDLVVLMARRRVTSSTDGQPQVSKTPKMICHVFESEEAKFIAQSIGQAFQVAYLEFLKANGIEDHSFVREMDYQEVLNSQEIFGDELQMFANKEMQKEVIVPKAKGEILGVVIVESGWGSMLPTVVIANLAPSGAAARCGHLNIGDQIIAINGISLVGLPLSTCQTYIKNAKNQTVVKLTVVPCAPVVEVKIKRPDTKYQLGFSVQNGVICSLLRGGIAERGGVRVGHRIIEINNQSVVAVPHERIVNLLATSVGEIHMKTMPTSMYRLLTGQETPVYI